MKKLFFTILFLSCIGTLMAQVPYYGATVGEHRLFGYHSLKVRPGINNQRTYTTLQYGINDWFSIGTDLTTGPDEKFIGYYGRVGQKFSKWFSVGVQMTPSFNLDDSHKFGYLTTGLFMNGNLSADGKLFWTSNTWHTANDGADNTLEQWWYLGGNFKLSENSSIWPHIGVVHSWFFDQDVDLAAGFFYVYKQYSLYLWGNDFFKEHPRLTLAVDLTF